MSQSEAAFVNVMIRNRKAVCVCVCGVCVGVWGKGVGRGCGVCVWGTEQLRRHPCSSVLEGPKLA